MSYEVLAQKWRPQSFQDVVGQAHVITTLQNQIVSNRVGHAYLFWGPRGTGKTTVARILAKAVNCSNRHLETEFSRELTAEPCNQCESCVEISRGRSFDVIEMDAASNRGIDPIRELRENTKLAPAHCIYKIYIIDEAHMLTQEAFNALLKTLEEPPPHVIFILATTERHKIPKTISSRCQDFDFRYMEQDEIVVRLGAICKAEDILIADEGLSLVARQSEGCLRDAENLLERMISSAGKELSLDQINRILGLGASHLIDELSESLLRCHLPESLQALANLAKQGTDLTQCLHQLIAKFRDLRLLAISPNLENLIQRSGSDRQRMREKSELASVERLSRLIKILMRTNSEIKQHGYAQVHLESALIDICSIQEGIQLGEVLRRLSEIEDKIDKGKVSTDRPLITAPQIGSESAINRPATPSSAFSRHSTNARPLETQTAPISLGSKATLKPHLADTDTNRQGDTNLKSVPSDVQNLILDSHELAKVWEQTLETLRTEKKMVPYQYLKTATLLPDQGNKLKISCARACIQSIHEDEKAFVAKTLTSLLGHSVQIEFVPSSLTPDMNTMTPPQKTQETTPMMLQYEAERDPQLSPALDLFEAKILKIEPK